MTIQSSTTGSSQQDTHDGANEAMINGGDNKNNSNEAFRSLPEKDTDTMEQTFLERWLSWRAFILCLLFLSYVQAIVPVSAMPISLVCMCGPVKSPTNATQNNNSQLTEFSLLENTTALKGSAYEFDWDSETRGLLLSGITFLGFMAPQLGNIVKSYLGNKMALTSLSVSLAFLSFVTPIAARTSVYLLLASRIILGMVFTANVPVAIDTIAWWSPAKERLTSSTILISGWIVGTSLGSLISGYFCLIDVDNGWPLLFYFHGILLVVWTIAWHCLSSQKPDSHPYISEQEKDYIVAGRVGMSQANTKGTESTPYRAIMKSPAFLAFIVRTVFHLWSLSIIFTCIPLYLTSVLNFSLQEAAIINAVMSILRLPAAMLWSVLGNWLLGRKNMTTNKVRKICYGLGQGLAVVLCVVVSFLDESHRWPAVVLLSACILCLTFGLTMMSVIPLDMAPRYASFISGAALTVGNVGSLTAPLVATGIAQQGTFEQWRIVWILMAVFNLLAALVFNIFGSAALQPWAVSEPEPPIVKVMDPSSSELKPSSIDSPASHPLIPQRQQ